eukprot:3047605-Amphidinium_carterae.2
MGMELNVHKTVIFIPDGQAPTSTILSPLWRDQPRTDGLVVCGLPIWSDPIDQTFTAVPCGTAAFLRDFLDKQRVAVQKRLEASIALAEASGSDQPGQHVALHIVRASVLAMHVHLLRAIHPDDIRAWATDIDGLVRDTFARITDIPIQANDDTFSYPPAVAGLGFSSLRREAPIHYVAQILASHHLQAPCLAMWTAPEEKALACLEADLGSSAAVVFSTTMDELAIRGRVKAVKPLRRALYPLPCDPTMTVPAPASMASLPLASAVMQRSALAWLHTPLDGFLLNDALRTALRLRLRAPVFSCAQTCQYTPATTQRPCGHPLD